jgi:hypothetical protein
MTEHYKVSDPYPQQRRVRCCTVAKYCGKMLLLCRGAVHAGCSNRLEPSKHSETRCCYLLRYKFTALFILSIKRIWIVRGFGALFSGTPWPTTFFSHTARKKREKLSLDICHPASHRFSSPHFRGSAACAHSSSLVPPPLRNLSSCRVVGAEQEPAPGASEPKARSAAARLCPSWCWQVTWLFYPFEYRWHSLSFALDWRIREFSS